jgi:uncharacterized protein (UPF0248 family)
VKVFCEDLIDGEEDDRMCRVWSISDDELLFYGLHRGENMEDLAFKLKRGLNGTIKRFQHLSNPKHNAFKRFYKIEEESQAYLKPCSVVIERILWDNNLSPSDFYFVYNDRFDGPCEKNMNCSNDNVKGKERLLVKAIPSHRISQIKFFYLINNYFSLLFSSSDISNESFGTRQLELI